MAKCKNCTNLHEHWCEKIVDSPCEDTERECDQYKCMTQRRNKVFRDMESNYRSGLYPICPQCMKTFDPAHIQSWTRGN